MGTLRLLAELGSLLAAFAVLALQLDTLPLPGPDDARRWAGIGFVQRNLRPDERVWIRSDFHPIAAMDASYYWTAFSDLVPATMALAQKTGDPRLHPELADASLPPCRALAGDEPGLRFISALPEDFLSLPASDACLKTLAHDRRLCVTPFLPIVDLTAPGERCDYHP